MKKIPDKVNKAINDFTKEVKKLLGDRIKKIILYGSYARRDFDTHSDIDIMILTDLDDNEISEYREKLAYLIYEVECKYDFEIYLSPLIKNIDKFNYWLEAMPFYMNVEKEGVVLKWVLKYPKN